MFEQLGIDLLSYIFSPFLAKEREEDVGGGGEYNDNASS